MEKDKKPQLICFRREPENWLEFPPLASSLQTVETAFMMIMMGRYPSALINFVSAIESAFKAALKIKSDIRIDLSQLTILACKESAAISHRKSQFDRLRSIRNKLIHYGYSPRDDAESAKNLLNIGFDSLSTSYKEFFDYDLIDSLVVEIAKSLKVGLDTFDITKRDLLDPSYCFIPMQSTLRQYFQPTFKPDWEYDVLQYCENNGISFNYVAERHKKIESVFKNSWNFWCPLCGENYLVAEIDDHALDTKQLKLNRVACCKCDFVIPSGCPELANVLLKEEIETERSAILKDFGHE